MSDARPRALLALTTTASEAEASSLARELLESHLVACATMLPGAKSMYWWQGKIDEASECLVLLKTTSEQWPALKERLPALHAYEVPELLALDVADGLEPYLQWLITQAQGVPR